MTDKRFTLIYGIDENPYEWDIMDNQEDCLIMQGNGVGICDLLNTLKEENEQLKNIAKSSKCEIEQLKECYKKVLNEQDDLAEENEQLKQENEHLFRQIKAFRDDCFTYGDFNGVSTINQLLNDLKDSKELFE